MVNPSPADAPRRHRFVVAAITTLLLGAIGSGIWETLLKPGVGGLGRFVLSVLALGSSRLRDLAYQSAALDPTSLPSLLIAMSLAIIPLTLLFGWGGSFLGSSIIKRIERRALAQGKPKTAILRTTSRTLNILLVSTNLLLGGILLTEFAVVNQAVLIWRVFHANLAVCAPTLSPEQEKAFKAKFAGMRSRADFQTIDRDLRDQAAKTDLRLVKPSLW